MVLPQPAQHQNPYPTWLHPALEGKPGSPNTLPEAHWQFRTAMHTITAAAGCSHAQANRGQGLQRLATNPAKPTPATALQRPCSRYVPTTCLITQSLCICCSARDATTAFTQHLSPFA